MTPYKGFMTLRHEVDTSDHQLEATRVKPLTLCVCVCCGKVDNPSMRWQMALYKEMAGKAEDADAPEKVVKRVQEVSAVLYHLEVVSGFKACLQIFSPSPDRWLNAAVSLSGNRRSIHSSPRRWCGTSCCPSRGAEPWWPASA